MSQLLKHYWVNRDNPEEFATTPEHFSRYRFGVIMPDISGLNIVHTLTDSNNITFFLSTCPDDVTIIQKDGLQVITQQEWDAEIASYDAAQEAKRYDILRKHRNVLLDKSDWFVTKSVDTGVGLSTAFVTWRQTLRDLPVSNTFPTEIPTCPEQINVDQITYNEYVSELRTIPMINDPLPPLQIDLSGDPVQVPNTEVPAGQGIPGDPNSV